MAQPSSSSIRDALGDVDRLLEELEFPFDSASAAATRHELEDIHELLRRYVLPRLRRMDAPLLIAVGGSTGSGKSTLVNALTGDAVTPSGVLRPTTRAPVLVHHPDDADWFGSESESGWLADDHLLVQRVAAEGVPPGVALLDTPPLDSVVTEIRLAALDSLAAADLWLFMTTAVRYADAVPWDLLTRAAERHSAVAVILNRVPRGAVKEVLSHLAGLLATRDLGEAPLFAVEEIAPDGSGLLPPESIDPVRHWVHELGGDHEARSAVVNGTVDGAIDHALRVIVAVVAEADADVLDDSTRSALADGVAEVRRVWEEPE